MSAFEFHFCISVQINKIHTAINPGTVYHGPGCCHASEGRRGRRSGSGGLYNSLFNSDRLNATKYLFCRRSEEPRIHIVGSLKNRHRSWGPKPHSLCLFPRSYLVNFLKALMPTVTTRMVVTTGIATGTMAEMAPVISPAAEVKAVTRVAVIPVASILFSFPISS